MGRRAGVSPIVIGTDPRLQPVGTLSLAASSRPAASMHLRMRSWRPFAFGSRVLVMSLLAASCTTTPRPGACDEAAVSVAPPHAGTCGEFPRCRIASPPAVVPPGFEAAEAAFDELIGRSVVLEAPAEVDASMRALERAVRAEDDARDRAVALYGRAAFDPHTRAFGLTRVGDLEAELAGRRPWFVGAFEPDSSEGRVFADALVRLADERACARYCTAWQFYTEALVHEPGYSRAVAQRDAFGPRFGELCARAGLAPGETAH